MHKRTWFAIARLESAIFISLSRWMLCMNGFETSISASARPSSAPLWLLNTP